MLVYANRLWLTADDGLEGPLAPVARWLTEKAKPRNITTKRLLGGGNHAASKGQQISSLASIEEFPKLLSVALSHSDSEVSGRRWTTEIGLRQALEGADIELTVLVHTSEISSRVTTAVVPGAPTFVREVLRACQPSPAATGIGKYVLDDKAADAFRHMIADRSREHSLVVLSPTATGSYLADPEDLQQQLLGLADLVVIPLSADTFWLARVVGRDFVPYRGAIRILYPAQRAGGITRFPTRIVTADEITERRLDERAVAREVLSLVVHRSNLPLSWLHVSPALVRETLLRRTLDRKRSDAVSSGNNAEYVRFLEEYVEQIEKSMADTTEGKTRVEEALEEALESNDDSARELRAKIEALKLQLNAAGHPKRPDADVDDDLAKVSSAITSAIEKGPTPEESLLLIEHFYHSRLVVLPEAWASARESKEFGNRQNRQKLYMLLDTLASGYWSELANGSPDKEARKVFGTSYAAKESETVLRNKGAKRKRTFAYKGVDILMEKHLKIGVKDSAAVTIRVHFEWISAEQRIVVGYCGQHIPFN